MAVEWDDAALHAFLNDPGGPVVDDLLPRLGRQGAALARARCPVQVKGRPERPPGSTRDSIGWAVGADSQGPYVDIGGDYVLIFLEKPASQMHRAYPVLTAALRDLAGRS